MNRLVEIVILVLVMLLIVSLVSIAVRRFRIPYTAALVLVGLGLSLRSRIEIELTSDIILTLLVPPLVFEAAFHINLDRLRHDLSTIALLAVPGVILTMLLVGGFMTWGGGLSLGSAFVFGALIAATDPVSVVALFRRLGTPKRLELLLEGESLFNDGTAIVVFNLALAAAVTGGVRLVDGVFAFVQVAGGGVVVGVLVGWLVSRLIASIDDHLVETTLTTVMAFGSYLLAEQLHLSGVLAVVMAGLINGNVGPRGMSPTTRIVVLNFWDYVAFLATSAVFLLIGLEIDLAGLAGQWHSILWAIAAVLLSRVISVYLLSRLGREMPAKWRHVLFWGGLRGAIALALALSLPEALGPERQAVILITFGVVLFTLLGQGLSMEWLVKKLRLISRSEEQIEYERRHARVLAARAGQEHLQRLYREGLISSHTWQQLEPLVGERIEALTGSVQEVLRSAPQLEADEAATARMEMLRAQRGMLANLRRDGVITEETYTELVAEIDAALETETDVWSIGVREGGRMKDVRHMLLVLIQSWDRESAANALSARGIPSTRIQSSGGFLHKPNDLLLVGVPP